MENLWDKILTKDKTFIIAEIGVNHNGDINKAKKLIDSALSAGVDAVKFQSFKTEFICTRSSSKSTYQLDSTDPKESFFDMISKLELSHKDHEILKKYAEDKGLIFLSTPCDIKSANMLEEIDVPLYKISSGDLNNIPLLRHISKFKKPMIISTGRASIEEIEESLSCVNESSSRVALLQCVSNYPANFEDLNLRSIHSLKGKFNIPIGFSDHSEGSEASIAAVALGAEIIEKHLTLDKNDIGPDHKASIEPHEFEAMVRSIRNIEVALGDGVKKPQESELWGRANVRKGLIANIDIMKGEIFSEENVSVKRPGKGLEPKYLEKVIGSIAVIDINKDDPIHRDDVNF